jgi:hypothetical protein
MILRGEYSLRAFDAQNMGDVERINLMFYHPQVMKAKGYFRQGYVLESQADLHSIDQQMFKIKSYITRAKQEVALAVIDKKSSILGWIWFYHDTRHPLPVRVQKELGITARNSLIYQLSYQKLLSTGWTAKLLRNIKYVTPLDLCTERKGVIVEGLHLAIKRLESQFRALYATKKLAFYAFVSKDNIASSKVLELNKFVKIGRKYKYDGENQDLWTRII